ncbi:hypothetical protein AKJ45_02860 [candidate division MSBL1 archaeon SCGC-AAA261F19]|uniref:Uncharacterized protein n=2 Tax=candidate division MSBL1 TaxID=215777 RepID=A0A133V9A4_9EURY|nr:hypothetical protein AKJ43_03120 [candidate division MSBL1 archaeon SCGC-AAA261D19]KXB02999.1 hypothetical protein AKJ45_02860 [candidate division MSBL1 archaeon SCGC-AAA261F19]
MLMAKGSGKYALGNLIFNYGKMYVFGGSILTALGLLWVIITGAPTLSAFIKQVVMVMVPNSNFFFLNLIINPLVGVFVATLRWSSSMKRRGYWCRLLESKRQWRNRLLSG